MGRVKLIVRPWLSTVMGSSGSGPITLDEEIGENATVGTVLAGVSARNPAFGEAVFDNGTGTLSGRISLVLNGRMLGRREHLDLKVKNDDTITLFPTIEGG